MKILKARKTNVSILASEASLNTIKPLQRIETLATRTKKLHPKRNLVRSHR